MSGIDMSAPGAWDDRALVKVWNAQVEEYKKYHGLHTNNDTGRFGEQLTDAEMRYLADIADPDELEEMGIQLTEAQARDGMNEEPRDSHAKRDNKRHHSQSLKDGEFPRTYAAANSDMGATRHLRTARAEGHPNQRHTSMPDDSTLDSASIMASGQQDALKTMQWAWFYAGYYQSQYEAYLRHAGQSGR